MSDAIERVRGIAEALGLSIPAERLEQVAEMWEQALIEADTVRQEPTEWPTSQPFDAAWGDRG